MARKAKAAPAGAPAWMVTFADLMSLLVCFFVLIISFSIMDDEKLQVLRGNAAALLGLTPKAVESRLYQARRALPRARAAHVPEHRREVV